MSRPVTVVVAAVALVVAVLGLLVGLAQSTVHFALPSATGVTGHTALFGPGVVAAAVAALVALSSALWLVLAVARRSARWMATTVLVLLAVDVAVLVVVSGLSRPSF